MYKFRFAELLSPNFEKKNKRKYFLSRVFDAYKLDEGIRHISPSPEI